MNKTASRGLLTLCLWAVSIHQAQAHSADEHAGHDAPATSTQEHAQVKFANVALLDQNGKTIRLEQDLVRDKIVVMSFIYTSCTTVCPVVSSIMGKVQKQLGSRVGSEVQLVSISIDPQRDDPKRLLDYARTFQKGPGWSWLTGSPQSINETLKGLGSFSGDMKSMLRPRRRRLPPRRPRARTTRRAGSPTPRCSIRTAMFSASTVTRCKIAWCCST
jgi:protein SCO1/2